MMTEHGLSTAGINQQQLVTDYIEASERLQQAKVELEVAKQAIEKARVEGELDSTWNRRSKAFLLGSLKIRSRTRETYSAKSYSDKLQKLMETERKDGIAKPTISEFFEYRISTDND